MITYDDDLAALLAGAINKQDWSTKIATALGDTRRLRCKRAPNAASTDVWADGTEFVNVELTGPIPIVSGNIAGFGTAGTTFFRFDADLSTGVSAIRVQGNGHWIQGSLGLAGSGCDFTLSSNPTTKTGIGFRSTAGLRAPRFLPSGTGPAAPVLTSDSPAYVEIEDWTDPNAPVSLGIIPFNTRLDDLVFDDADIATNIGDVRITQSNQSVIFRDFEFGAMLMTASSAINANLPEPVHQVLVTAKPYGRWAAYPAVATYDPETDTTFPNPFKAKVKTALGTVLHTFEMHDGKPINSPDLSQNRTTDLAIRPFWNCAEMLMWESAPTKMSSKVGKLFPGMTADSLRPSTAKLGDAANAPYPMTAQQDDAGQTNSMGHYYALPRWPMATFDKPGDTSAQAIARQAQANAIDPADDPYLYTISTYYSGGGATAYAARAMGWDYEPGSISGHDWYTGPGGPRFDRAVIPSPLAMYISDPNGVRLKGNVPFRQLADAWGKAYFNHSHHYVTNVKTFATLPLDEVLASKWSHTGFYYGSNDTVYVPGGAAKHVGIWAVPSSSVERTMRTFNTDSLIPLRAGTRTVIMETGKNIAPAQPIRFRKKSNTEQCVVGHVVSYNKVTGELVVNIEYLRGWPPEGANQTPPEENITSWSIEITRDKYGLRPYNGWAMDNLHNYCNPGYYTMLMNSPAHLVSAQHRFIGNILCQPGDWGDKDPKGRFLMRQSAWMWGQLVLMWKLASNHQFGISRAAIEKLFDQELANYYKYRYLPAVDPAHPEYNDIYNKAVRNLGIGISSTDKVLISGATKYYYSCQSIAQTYYFSHVFYLLKQTGCWAAMRARSQQNALVLDWVLSCLDKFAIDFILDTDGRVDGYFAFSANDPSVYMPGTVPVPYDPTPNATQVEAIVPENWADWGIRVCPKKGQEDWIRDPDGSIGIKNSAGNRSNYERDNTMHLRAQWAFMRRDCYPEIPNPRVQAACDKYQKFYDDTAAYVATFSAPFDKTVHDWHYRIVPHGIIKPPTELA